MVSKPTPPVHWSLCSPPSSTSSPPSPNSWSSPASPLRISLLGLDRRRACRARLHRGSGRRRRRLTRGRRRQRRIADLGQSLPRPDRFLRRLAGCRRRHRADDVVAATTVDLILAAEAQDAVRTGGPHQAIVVRGTENHVRARGAKRGVVFQGRRNGLGRRDGVARAVSRRPRYDRRAGTQVSRSVIGDHYLTAIVAGRHEPDMQARAAGRADVSGNEGKHGRRVIGQYVDDE